MDVRRWLRGRADLALGVGVTALYAVEVLAWGGVGALRVLPVAAAGGLGLALRRRAPTVGFLLAAGSVFGIGVVAPGLDNDSAALVITVFVSLYSLGRHAAGSWVWVGAAEVLTFIVAFVLGDAQGSVDSGDVGFALFFVGTPWAAGLALRLRAEREEVLRARNAELQRDQEERARQAVAEERSRIRRELHDVVSHAIAVTVLQARGARKVLGVDDEAVRSCLDAIEHTNTQALGDMRRLLHLLREHDDGPTTDPQPSLARLGALAEQVRASGCAVDLQVRGDVEAVPPGVDLSGYRIVQEALTNVLKHAEPGARARVEVTCGAEELDIAVTDDGVAAATGSGQAASGHGLLGIRERVAVLGGQVEAGPVSDGGFAVHARLPYAVESS